MKKKSWGGASGEEGGKKSSCGKEGSKEITGGEKS